MTLEDPSNLLYDMQKIVVKIHLPIKEGVYRWTSSQVSNILILKDVPSWKT